MKPGRVNLVLLLLISLLGFLMYYAERYRAEDEDRVVPDSPLLTMAPNDVNFLRLEYNQQIIELTRQEEQWTVVLPFKDRAANSLISGILESWRARSVSSLPGLTSSSDLSSAGLSPPEKTVVVGSQTARQSFFVGKSLPLEDSTYVQMKGKDGMFLSEGNPFEFIPENLNAFRQKVLFTGAPEDVKRFEVRGGENPIQCVREDDGSWTLLQPLSGRGNTASIQDFLDRLYEVKVERFVADQVFDPGIYSIDEQSPEIRLYFKGEAQPDIIQLGSQAGEAAEVYASDPSRSSVFTVAENILELLESDVSVFRDRRPVPYPVPEVREVHIRFKDKEYGLERKQLDNWSIRNPEPRAASEERVRGFLSLWTSPVIQDFFPSTEGARMAENQEVLGELEFIIAGDKEENLRKWPVKLYASEKKGLTLMHLLQDDVWASLPSALLDDLSVNPLSFYTLQVLEVDKKSIIGYTLETSSSTQHVVKTESGAFETEQGVVDLSQVALLEQAFASLNALAAVAESPELAPDEFFSTDPDALTVQVSFEVGISRKLLFGKRTPSGSRYMKVLGDPVIYLISKNTEALLLADVVQPRDPSDD